MNKKDWEKRRSRWQRALEDIASKHGKDSDIYKSMGSVAWGRYDGEPTSYSDNKDNVVFGAGFLQGVRHALLYAGRVSGMEGTYDIERIHDRIK